MSPDILSLGLPLLLAAILLASGGVKLRAAKRAHLGGHLPSMLELVFGAGFAYLAVRGAFSPGSGLWASLVAGVLVVASSVHLSRYLAEERARRQRSEGYRLEAFLRHQLGDEMDPG